MADRYWVGGTGNWNVAGNWSATSGGAGGAGVPGSADTAIFDTNSGTGTCTVDVTTTITRLTTPGYGGTLDFSTYGMTITGGFELYNGTVNGGSGTITVGGNIATTYSVFSGQTGTLLWNGSGSSTWRHRDNGHTFNDVTINGTGTLTYESDGGTDLYDIDGDLRVTGGTFKTKDPDETDADFDIEGDLIINGGTLDCSNSSSVFNVAGAVSFTSGTFTEGTSKVITDGTSTQAFTADEASYTFYDLQNSNTSADVDLGADLRVSHVLTIDASARIDTVATYDIYLEGNGTPLVLNGILYGNGSSLHYEVQTGGTTYITGSTGWNINGGLTGMAIDIQIIATVTATIRLSGHIRDVNNFQLYSTSAGSGATVAFYTDNYNIAQGGATPSGNGVYSFVRIGPELVADACTFTAYWGSSTIWWANFSFIRLQWDAATHNMQSATFRGGGSSAFSVYGPSTAAVDTAQTFNGGTSTVRAPNIGESWMGLGAHDGTFVCYDLILDNPGGVAYLYIKAEVTNSVTTTDNGSTQETNVECQAEQDFDTLTLLAQYATQTWEWYETNTTYVDTFNIDGTSSYDLLFRSRVPTNQVDIGLTDAGSASYMDVQDNALEGAIMDVSDGTSTNSGNNRNWRFSDAVAAWARQATQIAGF